MNKDAVPRTARYAAVVLLVSVLLLMAAAARAADPATAMQAYCSVPPLPGFGVRPNLLLMLDNSASMYDLAYTDPSLFCFDDTFNPAGSYPGYFDENRVYRYVTSGSRFTAVTDSIAASSCNQARTDFLCVNVRSKKVDTFLATGKFLNWLAMSKLDLEKLALTGGKYDPATKLMQAESRGCVGKRYVKMVYDNKGAPLPVTFGVRGPIPSESGYVSQANHGGLTRIEIYPAVYRKGFCLDAVKKWQENAGVPELSDAAGLCMGDLVDALGVPTPGKIFTETLSLCYSRGTDFGDAEATVIMDDCTRRYQFYRLPFQILRNTGEDICATKVYHNPRFYNGYLHTTGYLGECTQGLGNGFNAVCALNTIKDYCRELADPWLSDPSASANRSSTDAALPSFILDAGITSLGAPVATLVASVAADTPPSGLIQQFATEINFGAITFNDDGARSECDQGGGIRCVSRCSKDPFPQRECGVETDCDTRGPCLPVAKSDGGGIISHINHSPVGDHASGLIAAINAIRGTSWTPLAETLYQCIGYFSNNDSFKFQPEDFDTSKPPSRYSCQRNNVLIVTDGMSTADRAPALNAFVADAVSRWSGAGGLPAGKTTTAGTQASAAPPYQGSYNLDEVAWVARHRNIFDLNQPAARPKDYITTHVVYTGPPCGDKSGYNPDGSCATADEGVPEKMMQLTARNGGGSMKSVKDLPALQGALKGIFLQVIGGSSVGAGSSLLSTGDGNGALYLQPRFFPNKSYDGGGSAAAWTGELQSLWYYIDPLVGTSGAASSVREDTDGDKILDLEQDRVVRFEVPTPLGEARATLLTDRDGDGKVDVPQPAGYPLSVVAEEVQSLWRAGRQLWERSPLTRTLYTQTDGTTLVPFLDTSLDASRQLLQAKDQAEAGQIVAFVKGVDDPAGSGGAPTRGRSLKAYGAAQSLVWKLGDIVSSAPVVQSAVPLGSYHLPAPRGYGDSSYAKFVNASGGYGKRGTVYVGANDGMLHAFRLGSLKVRPDAGATWPAGRKALLAGSGLGEEQWGFIPKSALPYLRYLKEPLYPHLYYVDGTSTLVDASIGDPATCSRGDYWNCAKDEQGGSNWRTVIVGGMGLGGASRPYGTDCTDLGSSATCVKAPAAGVGGLSSYFALDVTGQSATGGTPRLLWEFSHQDLGFATSGAAILRIKARRVQGTEVIHDPDRNGRWFAVFASGPTGAVDRGTRQFTATSDQNLKLFVVDLNAAPPFVQGGNYWVIDTGIANAFGGSMAGAGIDSDKWNGGDKTKGQYEDEALYVGYTRRGDDGGWTGGVLRLSTGEDPNPATWETSRVIDGVGPVTGAVAKLQDRQYKRLWLYFGTGRHFHNQDDLQSARALFGVIEPCYSSGANALRVDDVCTAAVSRGDLTEVTDAAKVIPPAKQQGSYRGWWIALDGASEAFGSERALDAPSSVTSGAVFFPTYKPPLDACGEGVSYLWGVHYSTGGAVGAILGQAVLPLSNGSAVGVDLSGFTDRAGRRSAPLPGKAVKPRLVTNSGLRPLKRIIHMQER